MLANYLKTVVTGLHLTFQIHFQTEIPMKTVFPRSGILKKDKYLIFEHDPILHVYSELARKKV